MDIEKQGNASLLRLPQRLAGKVVKDMVSTVKDAQEKEHGDLALDFSSTEFVDSSGIGSLVSMAQDFKSRGNMLTLRELNDELKDLFSETGLDMIFNIETESGVDNAKVDIFEMSVDIRLEITQDTDDDMCVFHMAGVMNHPMGSRYFKQRFLLAMAHYTKILLDFENLTFFDSLSVSVVLNMNRLLKETGGSLRICAANYIVDDLFSTLNINQIIPIFDDVEKAKGDWK